MTLLMEQLTAKFNARCTLCSGEHPHNKALLCEALDITSDRYNVCARESP